ncbi:MAG: glycosyltransferase family 39 protein [Patescibacteria group bacterium]|nr:glycosyltransferase family 39 protein [Patescibacteria group bacterium]
MPEKIPTATIAILLALILFAFLFAVFFMFPQSLGLDEAQSLWQSDHTATGIFYVVAQDVHVPLYHELLHFWQLWFGNGVPAARALSLLFYLPTIPLVYLLGRIAFRKESVGIFGAALFALSPFTSWYGSIIRMYSLLALITVVNQIFFLLIYKGAKSWRSMYWFGYFLSGLFGIYTHYFFWFVLLVQALFFFAYRDLFPERSFRNFAIVAGILALALTPWLWYVHKLGGFGANTSPKLSAPTTVDVFNTFSNFLFGFQTNPINTVILSSWPLLMLFAFLALQKNKRVPPETAFFLGSFAVPIAIAAILSHFVSPFFLSRYFIGVFPAFCLAVSWFLTLYPGTMSRFAKAALVGMVAISLQTQMMSPQTPVKEDYRDVAAYVSAHATARDIVAASAPFTVYPLEYYYNGPAALTTLPIWNQLQTGAIPAFSTSTLVSNAATFKAYEKLWLILSYDQGYEQSMRVYFDTHYERLEVDHYASGLDLYVYRLRYDSATLTDALKIAQAPLPATSTLVGVNQ